MTDEGRARERLRRALLSGIAAVAARGFNAVSALITVPLTLRYLGTERYGMWMTISSTIVMMGFADLGIGNGLLGSVARSLGAGDRAAVRRDVSSALFMLSVIGAAVIAGCAASYPFVSWGAVFGVHTPAALLEAQHTMVALLACFALNLPLSVVQRTQDGFQESYIASSWQVAASIVGLVAVVTVIRLEGGLVALVCAISLAPACVTALNGYLFFRGRPWAAPKWAYVDLRSAYRLASDGALFLVLQLAALVCWNSDNIVIARYLGASAVSRFSVVFRLYTMTLFVQIFITPLWPAFGEAVARGDHAWAERMIRRAAFAGLAMALMISLGFVAAGREIVRAWVGADMVPSVGLLYALASWILVQPVVGTLSAFMNGVRPLMRAEAAWFVLTAVTCVLLKVLLVPRMGVVGSVWATSIPVALIFVPGCVRAVSRFFAEAKSETASVALIDDSGSGAVG